MAESDEFVEQLFRRTPSGEGYIIKSFPDGKVFIELLRYQVTFEPKIIIYNGQISFAGRYLYAGKEHEIIIPGENETVKLYEKAKN